MFIRTKVIKNHAYAYLVRSKWTRKGTRQKVSKYLGKVHVLEPVEARDFEPRDVSAKKMIEHLIIWVLGNHGFSEKDRILTKKGLTVNLRNQRITEYGRNVVLKIDDDYMSGHSIRALMNFKSDKDEMGVGHDLAKAFIGAGIPVPQYVFIDIFSKVYKEGQSFVE